MKDKLKIAIKNSMLPVLNNGQLKFLEEVLDKVFEEIEVNVVDSLEKKDKESASNISLLDKFIEAKQLEGCSNKTLTYYRFTINQFLEYCNSSVLVLSTEDIRKYLTIYQTRKKCSKVSIDNIRRILSSFFSWLEDEDYIVKSPVRRIHKIRVTRQVKETFSDESLELMKSKATTLRDMAIVNLLASTGMRVGELVGLDTSDIDFIARECVVLGKGNKERLVYFDARTKMLLKEYLESRTDDNPALFVTLNSPHKRLKISGVEIRMRQLGLRLNIHKVHPHKFRRSLATKAIDKGMPIEQVQKLLGHSKIDTTLEYAMVDQNNVKNAHKKYIA